MKLTFCTWIKKHRNATLLHWFVFLRHLQTIWFGKYWGERIVTGHRSPSYWHHGRYTRRCERWRSVECNSHHHCGNAKDVHGSEMRYVQEILCIFMRNISMAAVNFNEIITSIYSVSRCQIIQSQLILLIFACFCKENFFCLSFSMSTRKVLIFRYVCVFQSRDGLVGYDARFTRGRSRVRFPLTVQLFGLH